MPATVGRPLTRERARARQARFCMNYLKPSVLLGDPKTNDPHQHLFGECAHGVGHGSYGSTGGNGLCYMVGREVWEGCAECPGDAKKLWEAACAGGAKHMREDSEGVFG